MSYDRPMVASVKEYVLYQHLHVMFKWPRNTERINKLIKAMHEASSDPFGGEGFQFCREDGWSEFQMACELLSAMQEEMLHDDAREYTIYALKEFYGVPSLNGWYFDSLYGTTLQAICDSVEVSVNFNIVSKEPVLVSKPNA